MGNEASSIQPHAGLTKSDIENLQKHFPKTPSKHLWPPWTEVFQPEELQDIEQSLVNKTGVITFQNYQQLAGDVGKGGLENKVNFLLKIAKVSKSELNTDLWKKCVRILANAYSKKSSKKFLSYENDAEKLASSLTHSLIFPSEKRKSTLLKADTNVNIDLEEVEKLLMNNPLIEDMISEIMNYCFKVELRRLSLLPSLPNETETSLSALQILFLNSQLPHELRCLWRPLFNTNVHGESFAKFAGCIMHQGPTIIVIWDEKDNVFGGFATDSWKLGPKFYGRTESFLFHLHPKMNIYESTPFNTNFQYFNLKQKTMPNGLGIGGQLDYFGLWIDSEFGIVKTSPSCSTYHSAQLGELDGKIKKLEVFGVGELIEDEMEGGRSVLDMDPEAQAVLEMMGKTFHSKVIREVDKDNEEKEKLEKQQQD